MMTVQGRITPSKHSSKGQTVLALHCSGAGGEMWQPLRDELQGRADVIAPGLYGAADGPQWHGEHAFSLDDEAAPIIGIIDSCSRPVHLVGHSYGGSVALHAALARPQKVASLTLYEPASFHLLKVDDGVEFAEIAGLAKDVGVMVGRGDAHGAMKRFVDYWGGRGAWASMRPDAQMALVLWAPKATLDFQALLNQSAHASQYQQLEMPCMLLSGERSPDPIREVARLLCSQLPGCQMKTLEDTGHMGPFSNRVTVAKAIAEHVRSVGRMEKVRQCA